MLNMKINNKKIFSVAKLFALSMTIGIISFFGFKANKNISNVFVDEKEKTNINSLTQSDKEDSCYENNEKEAEGKFLYIGCNNFF